MPISCPFKITLLQATEVGELVCIVDQVPTWGVVLLKNRDGSFSLAVLRSGIEGLDCPIITNFHDHQECMTFGSNWVFEVLADADADDFGDASHRRPSGWLVRGEAVALRFKPNNREGISGAYMDMEKFSAVSATHGDGVYGTRWRIWKSECERTRVGGTPLLVSEPTKA